MSVVKERNLYVCTFHIPGKQYSYQTKYFNYPKEIRKYCKSLEGTGYRFAACKHYELKSHVPPSEFK